MNRSGGWRSGQAGAYTRSLVMRRHRVRPGTPAQVVWNVLQLVVSGRCFKGAWPSLDIGDWRTRKAMVGDSSLPCGGSGRLGT